MSTTVNPFLLAIQQMQALNTKPATETTLRAGRIGTKQVTNPEGLALRVFKDGRVYPSQELVDTFNLEYQAVDANDVAIGIIPQGLDLFMAHDLPNFDKNIPNSLLIASVAKSGAKVDLFKTTEYNEDGTPKSSVMNQAPTTFGKNSLIPMLEVVLNKESSEIFAEQKFVDLVVEVDYQLPLAGDFLYVPKTVARGPKKGEVALIRRGATKVYPLTIKDTAASTLTEQEGMSQEEEMETEAITTATEEALHTV